MLDAVDKCSGIRLPRVRGPPQLLQVAKVYESKPNATSLFKKVE